MCWLCFLVFCLFFFFNDTATTEIYTLSLHDALPISSSPPTPPATSCSCSPPARMRSEEHTSELQSRPHLVCRLLLEKKKKPPETPKSKTTTTEPNINHTTSTDY